MMSTPDIWSATTTVVPETATFLACPGVLIEPRSVGFSAFETSRTPQSGVTGGHIRYESETLNPQIFSGNA